MKVKFYTAAGLINEMLAAQQEYKLNRLEKQFLSYHLVVIDELGYVLLVRPELNYCSNSVQHVTKGAA